MGFPEKEPARELVCAKNRPVVTEHPFVSGIVRGRAKISARCWYRHLKVLFRAGFEPRRGVGRHQKIMAVPPFLFTNVIGAVTRAARLKTGAEQ
jgi:hypothetical protein